MFICYLMKTKIFCFDFDLTLTKSHSFGYPNININYFDNINKIISFFQNIIHNNNLIYIVSRADKQSLIDYLKYYNLLDYIKKVYGSNDEYPINSNYWFEHKTHFLNEISIIENIDKSQIIYFDDEYPNVKFAINNGFIHSFIVKENGSYLLNIIDNFFTENALIHDVPKNQNLKFFQKFSIKELINLNLDNKNDEKVYIYSFNNQKFTLFKNHLVKFYLHNILVDNQKWNPNLPLLNFDLILL